MTANAQAAPPASPSVGVLQPTYQRAAQLVGAGFSRAQLEIAWELAEPEQGQFDKRYLAERVRFAQELRAAGYDVVLDTGLQYPPDWALDIPGARFVDQDGTPWSGGVGEDVPDAVWNPAVRTAQRSYLQALATELADVPIVAVRVGGLLYGELRMPPATFDGAAGRLWGYSAAAQLSAPTDWRPGTGDPDEALTWLQWYCDSLTAYETWLLEATGRAFPGVHLQVLFPGWGLRPGDLQAAANQLGDGTTVAERGDTVSSGLDWPAQVRAAADASTSTSPVTVYSTWLDAPSYGANLNNMAPPSYLFRLARQAGLEVAGENTGGGGMAAVLRARAQTQQWGLSSVMWMSEPSLTASTSRVKPRDVTSAFGACTGQQCGVRRR